MLGFDRPINVRGTGWVGSKELLVESDPVSGSKVIRLATRLAAANTTMSFWVSYMNESSSLLAAELVSKVTHAAADA